MLQPTIPAITNDLAPDHLRGRYNAVTAGAFQAGTIAGPVVAGLLLDRGWDTGFVATLVAGCGLMTVLTLVVERNITPAVNGVGPRAEEPPVPDVGAPAGPTPTAG
jgi:MFS family permease